MVVFEDTIDVTLGDDETERFVVPAGGADAIRSSITADAAGYEIDILTAEAHPDPADFDLADYTSVVPDPLVIDDTDDHVVGTVIHDKSVAMAITNTSGGNATYSGSISLNPKSTAQTPLQYASKGSGERPAALLDGRYTVSEVLGAKAIAVLDDSGSGVTVTAGGTTTVTTSITDPTRKLAGNTPTVWAESDPGAAFGLEPSAFYYDGTNWAFDVTETQSNTGVTFSWRALRFPR